MFYLFISFLSVLLLAPPPHKSLRNKSITAHKRARHIARTLEIAQVEGTALCYEGVLFIVLSASFKTSVPLVCAEIGLGSSQATLCLEPRQTWNTFVHKEFCHQVVKVPHFKC